MGGGLEVALACDLRLGSTASTFGMPEVKVGIPSVIHAALVSIEDNLLGEKSCAYLVVKAPLRAVAVRRFLREQGIAEFKLPDRVECVDALPLTPVGKVDKKQLRQWLAERQPG